MNRDAGEQTTRSNAVWHYLAVLATVVATAGSCGQDGKGGETGRCKVETMEAGTSADLFGVWGEVAGDVYVVGSGGAVLKLGESGWSAVDTGLTGSFNDVWGGPGGEWFVVGSDSGVTVIGHHDGEQWEEMTHPHPHPEFDEVLTGVWGSATDDVYAVGEGGGYRILRYDGSQWIMLWEGAQALTKVWGAGPDFILATGDTSVLIYDGSEWSPLAPDLPSPTCAGTVHAAWGSAADNFYAVCEACTAGDAGSEAVHPLIARYSGGAWTAVVDQNTSYEEALGPGANAGLTDVWGFSSDAVFAVGEQYSFLVEGDQISTLELAALSVWGRGLEEIYAVGRGGSISRIDCGAQ
jgi:hypothetical protein